MAVPKKKRRAGRRRSLRWLRIQRRLAHGSRSCQNSPFGRRLRLRRRRGLATRVPSKVVVEKVPSVERSQSVTRGWGTSWSGLGGVWSGLWGKGSRLSREYAFWGPRTRAVWQFVAAILCASLLFLPHKRDKLGRRRGKNAWRNRIGWERVFTYLTVLIRWFFKVRRDLVVARWVLRAVGRRYPWLYYVLAVVVFVLALTLVVGAVLTILLT